jgi:hypothetical protein
LRSAGYSFQFLTRSAAARMDFKRIDSLSTRSSPGAGTRAYGGIASERHHIPQKRRKIKCSVI